jgi:hypothetical protein
MFTGDEIVLLRSVIAELVRRVSELENAASRTRDRSRKSNLPCQTPFHTIFVEATELGYVGQRQKI